MVNFNDFKNWEELQWKEFEIQNSIDAMKELLKYVETSWKSTREKLDKQLEEFYKDYEDFQGSISGTPYDYETNLMIEIKSRGYFSVFLSAYAILEGTLNKLCHLIQDEFDFKIKLEDLNSRIYLDHYKIYLTKVYGLEFSDFESYWTKITKYASLRNLFIHEDGLSKKIGYKKKLTSIKYLDIFENNGSIAVSIQNDRFFELFFKELYEFFKKLIELIDKKYTSLFEFKKKIIVKTDIYNPFDLPDLDF